MKKILIFTLAIAFVMGNGFFMFEGVMASAATVTDGMLHGGLTAPLVYNEQLNVDAEMSLTCDTATIVDMTGTINGMTGGEATGSRLCTAITNNYDGYTMTAAVTTMTSVTHPGHTFSAYAGATSSWAAVGAGNSGFGFQGVGGWIGSGAGATTVGSSVLHTDLDGEDITVNYKAEVGATSIMPSGMYQATTTVDLVMN